MSSPKIFEFNIKNEVGRLFDESSKSSLQPTAVILIGGIASGKTTLRKQKYSRGYVLIDAGDMFLNLSRGEFLPFPGPLESAMEVVGQAATKRALSERRHVVTEIIGADEQATDELTNSLADIGYKLEVMVLTCSPDEAAKRNANRNIEESISAHYSEPFHRAWIIEAATELASERVGKGLNEDESNKA
jgi:dephospho-CoA kinase